MDSEMKTPRVISIPLSRDCLIKISFVSMEELRHKLEKEKTELRDVNNYRVET